MNAWHRINDMTVYKQMMNNLIDDFFENRIFTVLQSPYSNMASDFVAAQLGTWQGLLVRKWRFV